MREEIFVRGNDGEFYEEEKVTMFTVTPTGEITQVDYNFEGEYNSPYVFKEKKEAELLSYLFKIGGEFKAFMTLGNNTVFNKKGEVVSEFTQGEKYYTHSYTYRKGIFKWVEFEVGVYSTTSTISYNDLSTYERTVFVVKDYKVLDRGFYDGLAVCEFTAKRKIIEANVYGTLSFNKVGGRPIYSLKNGKKFKNFEEGETYYTCDQFGWRDGCVNRNWTMFKGRILLKNIQDGSPAVAGIVKVYCDEWQCLGEEFDGLEFYEVLEKINNN